MTTLAAVVGSEEWRLAAWNLNKVHLDDPLTQFHKKFWGKEEKVRWSDDVEVDADGDDIGPHCYPEDIGIQGIEEKIWIRADYIRIFEYAQKFYAESLSNPQPLSPCLVITGQPGIGEFADVITLVLLTYQIPCLGKTTWRWYALRVCCAQKKPVIFYANGSCWLFVKEGVYRQPPNFEPRYYKIVIWTLVDSADLDLSLPTGLTSLGTQHFVIYTTSPTQSRWKKIHQTMLRILCVMNPWTKAEIHKA